MINMMNMGVNSCAIPNQIMANTSQITGGVACTRITKGEKIRRKTELLLINTAPPIPAKKAIGNPMSVLLRVTT